MSGRPGEPRRRAHCPSLEILVDDSRIDVQILQEALEGARVLSRLHSARARVEVMAFLRREGPFKSAPRPGLMLLDVHIPRKGGLEALRKIRSRPAWQSLRVVAFSSGERPDEIAQCRTLGA